MEALKIIEIAVKALDDKKAKNIKAMHITDLTILSDYFLIASGMSTTQVRALAEEAEYRLSQAGVEPGHIEGRSTSWILLDYGTVVIHVFLKDAREFYDLEKLWVDAEPVDLSAYLSAAEQTSAT